MSATLPPAVLILDDGELEDVRSAARELGAEILPSEGSCAAPASFAAADALIANERAARSLVDAAAARDRALPPACVAVLEGTDELRGALPHAGFHFVVHRPVHPAALRLFLLHVLYRGPERRRERRVSVGARVRVLGRFWPRHAVLLELSVGGCRLDSPRPLRLGSRVLLALPAPIAQGRRLWLRGRALRALSDSSGDGHVTAIRFGAMGARKRRRLLGLVEQFARGPAELEHALDATLPREGGSPIAAEATDSGRGGCEAAERRAATRRAYARRVISRDDEAVRVLIGRDLSTGGMRIESNPSLALGDLLEVAIYGEPGKSPLVVRALVARDDGVRGCVLRFQDLSAAATSYLERLVDSLPVAESRPSGGRLVVAEVVAGPGAAY
jgi:hypothetical protein